MIVAEIGNNHEGSFELAIELLNKAAEAGADAVKFQTFIPELFVSAGDTNRMETLKKFQLDFDQFKILSQEAVKLGVIFFSTPLDLKSAAFLDQIQEVFKIASGDNNFCPLIDYILSTGKSLIISTGASEMAMLEKIYERIDAKIGAETARERLAFLHCVSSYPAPPDQSNISAIRTLKKAFPEITIGYSDHCLGIEHAIFSVSAGAEIVEKHFTLDNNYSDFRDHSLSADPRDFRQMVDRIRELEHILGDGEKTIQDCEKENCLLIRRSLVAARDIPAGKLIEYEDLVYLRPGTGIPADQAEMTIGRKMVNTVKKGDFLSAEDIVKTD